MEQTNPIQQVEQKPCASGCGFWGNPLTKDLCSKCYREQLQSRNAELEPATVDNLPVAPSPVSEPVTPKKETQVDTTRCWKCERKLGLTGITCRCGFVYCANHRHAHQHKCTFDYQQLGKELLTKSNPCVQSPKLEKI